MAQVKNNGIVIRLSKVLTKIVEATKSELVWYLSANIKLITAEGIMDANRTIFPVIPESPKILTMRRPKTNPPQIRRRAAAEAILRLVRVSVLSLYPREKSIKGMVIEPNIAIGRLMTAGRG
jgi:hypothetical protein